MRPITVNVGPVGATTFLANNAALPAGGCFNLSGTPNGGSNVNTFLGNCTITNGVLTVNSTSTGVMAAGARLMAAGLAPNSRVLGPGPTPGTWIVYPSVSLAATAVRANPVLTLDAPRQLVIANTEAAGSNSFTIVGTDAAGNPISETLVATGGNLTTSQSFATITQASAASPTVNVSSLATSATATSPWVMFDPYVSGGNISKQCLVTGAANYTVQVSYDDPNAVAPGAMGWTNDTDPTFVGATTSLSGSWPYVPFWARVLLNSGAGSVRATFMQPGNLGR